MASRSLGTEHHLQGKDLRGRSRTISPGLLSCILAGDNWLLWLIGVKRQSCVWLVQRSAGGGEVMWPSCHCDHSTASEILGWFWQLVAPTWLVGERFVVMEKLQSWCPWVEGWTLLWPQHCGRKNEQEKPWFGITGNGAKGSEERWLPSALYITFLLHVFYVCIYFKYKGDIFLLLTPLLLTQAQHHDLQEIRLESYRIPVLRRPEWHYGYYLWS